MRVKGDECLATTYKNNINLYRIDPQNFVQHTTFLRHELQHIIQYDNTKFYALKYLFNSLLGYNRNKYEIDAENHKISKFPDDYVIVADDLIVMTNQTYDKHLKHMYIVDYNIINKKFGLKYTKNPKIYIK